MTQDEFLEKLEKELKVIDILKKRLDMAIRSLDRLYEKRSQSITELLKLSPKRKYRINYRVKELGTNVNKDGFFYAVEFNKKTENFVVRLKGIKRNGEPSKIVEPINEAIAITDIINISILN